jgi:hypothetical protein
LDGWAGKRSRLCNGVVFGDGVCDHLTDVDQVSYIVLDTCIWAASNRMFAASFLLIVGGRAIRAARVRTPWPHEGMDKPSQPWVDP